MLNDLAHGMLAAAAYGGVGIAVLAVGYMITDALTPGKLADLIYRERNWNATALSTGHVISSGIIVVTAIWTSHDDLGKGLIDSVAYGLLGVLIVAIAFVVVDKLTPGDLGQLLTHSEFHPAVLLTVATDIVVASIVALAIA